MASTLTDANAARRTALGGNQFIKDQDDVYPFPHLNLEYSNRMILDMPATDDFSTKQDGYFDYQWGSGTLIFGGDDWAWNFPFASPSIFSLEQACSTLQILMEIQSAIFSGFLVSLFISLWITVLTVLTAAGCIIMK